MMDGGLMGGWPGFPFHVCGHALDAMKSRAGMQMWGNTDYKILWGRKKGGEGNDANGGKRASPTHKAT